MPRNKQRIPSYCLHKASGRAVVRINGRDIYLGKHGTPESHEEYHRAIARWQAARVDAAAGKAERVAGAGFDLTTSQVLIRYKAFAESYYVKNGEPTKELTEMRYALRPVRRLFGDAIARDFGPLRLKQVREHMIDSDLSRGVINNRVNRIKRFFKWAVAEELVPPNLYEGLRAVTGLKRGRTRARETDPVQPVPDEHVEAVLPAVAPQVAAMIRLQRLTGMRPCETVAIREQDIDRSGEVWTYEPEDHKNLWRGHRRLIAFGPTCQEILRPFLDARKAGYLFSPRDAEAHRNAQRRRNRQTPMTPSQRKRKPESKPKRAKRDVYDVASYRRAIKYGIEKVNKQRSAERLPPIPHWCPLQLRHARATELNERFGIEAAAVSLGHAHADVTKVYAERNWKLAVEVARVAG